MKTLSSPIRLGSLQPSSRVVMAPMTRNQSKNHIPGPHVAQYYRRRAEAGVGLIVTEGTMVNHKGAHGYLIDQFFWSRTNHRTDVYGGKTLAGSLSG